MKLIPLAMSADLRQGVTTLCWCWRLTPKSGAVLGFTDHDRDVTFEGTIFEATSGFTATEIQDAVGLGVDNLEVSGALSSDRLAEADLAAGVFDDAKVEIFRVDWQTPDNRVLMRTGSLGEVRRSGSAFNAEVRGLAHYLQQPNGRLYQYQCDADLGDHRCTVVTNTPTFTATGAITEILTEQRFEVSGLLGYPHDWFTRGLLTFVDGPFAGQAREIKAHGSVAGVVTLELWQPTHEDVTAGLAFTVVAGCDKARETCRDKFANVINFRGFPDMPGNDFITTFAKSSSS